MEWHSKVVVVGRGGAEVVDVVDAVVTGSMVDMGSMVSVSDEVGGSEELG